MITKDSAVARLGREVPAAESAIYDAMLRVLEITQTSIQAIPAVGIDLAEGQAAIARLHKTFGTLIGAQSDMLRVHGQMSALGREHCVGDEPYCPGKTTGEDQSEVLADIRAA